MSEKTEKAARKAAEEAQSAKGWKINLIPYEQKLPVFNDKGDPTIQGTEQLMETTDFDVRESLASLCFNRELMNEPEAMFKAKAIADKIRGANKSVVLDNAEMEHIRKAYGHLKGLPERFVEFMERIRDAEEISLKEATEEAS